ncbi:MAG TPA: hypothetical protein VJA16_16840 [Thermoanaerobaculia bacterium]
MRLKQALVAVMLAGTWALGCSNSNSPTSANAFTLAVNVSLANTANAATITGAQLIVDGATAVIFSQAAPAASAALGTTGQAGAGPHTLQVLLVSQTTSSPTSYTVANATIQVFDLNQTLLKTITLPTQTAALVNGGSINYNFSL